MRRTAGLLLWCLGAAAAAQQLPAGAVEQRNAAAAFAAARSATLGMLRTECTRLVPSTTDLAQAWWDRRRDEAVAGWVWIDRHFAQRRAADAAEAQQAALHLQAVTAAAVGEAAVRYFKRERPNAESCQAALRQFGAEEADFARFSPVLREIRAEPGFGVPPHLNLDFESLLRFKAVASLEAAIAARQRGDGATARAIYSDLAARGDAQAAQAMGVIYLSGDQVPVSDPQAWRWFYLAWVLGDTEGLNAMGVMLRDGRHGPAQPALAWTAFMLAAASSNPQARARAQHNAQRLEPSLAPAVREPIACLRLAAFDAELRKRLREGDAGPNLKVPRGERRLGELAPALAAGKPLNCG